ncbi:MAG: hypothetical protein BWZ10_01814 [candidate division BRC1 bacterium ADurb.BinA364]|nr:MAG: hypothetical protein BWZ10_01814 [candidate division BRC1 bacterium ADurb.BinA364]
MRKHAYIALAFLFLAWLEMSVLPFLAPRGALPRLTSLFAIGVALRLGPLAGALWGFAVGLLLSLASGEPFGLASLGLTGAAWAAGEISSRFPVGFALARMALALAALALESALAYGAAWIVFGYELEIGGLSMATGALLAPAALAVSDWLIAKGETAEA